MSGHRRPMANGLTGIGQMANPAGQRGMVLIFALILLLVMTVLAVSGVGNSMLEQRMAGNYTHSMTAFQAAEQGLRVAEEWLYKKQKNDDSMHEIDKSTWWFRDTSLKDGLYTALSTHDDNAKVCGGDPDCEFNPRDESQWCSDTSDSNCKLPKGFIELSSSASTSTSLYDLALSSVGADLDDDGTIDTVAKQPRFIIEYVGPKILGAKNITMGVPDYGSPLQSFRITVIAWGPDESTRHVLQGHVVLRL